MHYFVYLIRNKINNKLYVGKSNDPEYRFRKHKEIASRGPTDGSGLFQAIHAAMRKYGSDNFEMKVVEDVCSEEISYQLETEWIILLRQEKYVLYNENDGGLGGIGYHHTNETKAKMSKTRKGKPISDKTKDGLMKFLAEDSPANMAWRQKVAVAKTGTNNPSSKLSELEVMRIRILLQSKEYSQKEIARMFGVDPSTISNIKRGKNWLQSKP